MKLAKLDFLLRYPNCLVRVLEKLGKAEAADAIGNEERNTIEARMIRFRYEPWDSRYRRWIGVLVAKSLANTYLEGRTVRVQLTSEGAALADTLGELPEFSVLKKRSDLIKASVGAFSGSKLKDFIYEVFPEILDMSWGHRIEL